MFHCYIFNWICLQTELYWFAHAPLNLNLITKYQASERSGFVGQLKQSIKKRSTPIKTFHGSWNFYNLELQTFTMKIAFSLYFCWSWSPSTSWLSFCNANAQTTGIIFFSTHSQNLIILCWLAWSEWSNQSHKILAFECSIFCYFFRFCLANLSKTNPAPNSLATLVALHLIPVSESVGRW